MDANQKRAFNLRVLKQHDQAVEDILDGTSYAVLYSFVEGVGWKKEMVEGSMFIFTRSVVPRYGLFILNRSGPDNFITLFTGTDDLQLTGDYIIFRPADEDAIWGVWVFDASHRPRIAKCIEDIEQLAAKEKAQAPAKVDTFVDPAIASISSSPAHPQAGTSNGVISGQPVSVDDLFGNFDSPALSATNAAPAPSTLPSIGQNFNIAMPQQQQQQQVPSQYENVKASGTQELLSFLGLPPSATVDNSKHVSVQQQTPPQHQHALQAQMQVPTLPPSGPISPFSNAAPAPAPLSIPIDPMATRLPQQSSQTPLSEPSVPPTPLPLSAVTPSEPRNPIVLNDELESLKRLTFEEGKKEQQSPVPDTANPQQNNQQFNKNFPPLGISPPTAPRAERERQQKMMQMQQQSSSGALDEGKPSPGLFNPGIRTQVRTVPKTRKPSAIGHIQLPSIVSPNAFIDNIQPKESSVGQINGAAQVPQVPQVPQVQQVPQLPQAHQVPQAQPVQQVQQVQQPPHIQQQQVQHTPEVPRISPQVGLDVMTPTLSLLRHPSGHKLDQQGFKQALASLVLENDEFLSILYQRYVTC